MFFDVFARLCSLKGKTPNGVAKELNFASSSVTQWKHGSTPRPVALQKIAEYFGVSVSYLIGETDAKKTAPGVGDGLEEEIREIIQLLNEASPELRAAALAVLKSAAGQK